MATQTIEFEAPSGLSITLKLFNAGADTVLHSVAATERTNKKGFYTIAITDTLAELCDFALFVGASCIGTGQVKLENSTSTFAATEMAGLSNIFKVTVPKVPVVAGRSNTAAFRLKTFGLDNAKIEWGHSSGFPKLMLRKENETSQALALPTQDANTRTNRLVLTAEQIDDLADGWEIDYYSDANGPYATWVAEGSLRRSQVSSGVGPILDVEIVDPDDYGSGAAGTPIVWPTRLTTPERIVARKIVVYVNETLIVPMTITDANEDPVDLSGLELGFYVEDERRQNVLTIPDDDIEISGADDNVATIELPDTITDKIGRKLAYALRNVDGNLVLGFGEIEILYAPGP